MTTCSLDAEIDKMIGKAASTLARLKARVWTSPKMSMKTKMAVYNACVISTLLYGSDTWTTYAGQERRLNSFHLRSIRHILGISWQDKVSTVMSCLVQVFPVCTLCSDNADCDDWVMSAVWRMIAFLKTSSTVSCIKYSTCLKSGPTFRYIINTYSMHTFIVLSCIITHLRTFRQLCNRPPNASGVESL